MKMGEDRFFTSVLFSNLVKKAQSFYLFAVSFFSSFSNVRYFSIKDHSDTLGNEIGRESFYLFVSFAKRLILYQI